MVLICRPRSRRSPWPHNGTIGGYGFRFGYFEKGGAKLVGMVPEDQGRVAPAQFGEQAIDPIFGAPLAIRNLTRGYGQRRLRGLGNGRYWYTLNAAVGRGGGLKGRPSRRTRRSHETPRTASTASSRSATRYSRSTAVTAWTAVRLVRIGQSPATVWTSVSATSLST
mgnify:CR=1 FL=1